MSTKNTVELSELDFRYESYRIKHPKAEKRLLLSISQRGIRDPLKGVRIGDTNCLLDGFKRVRCARRLSIGIVPYCSLGNDEALGIIEFMRESFSKGLNVIEQIKLIEALKNSHGISNREIADHLEKSAAWVGIRIAMGRELTPKISNRILAGKFPARSYLYGILPITRVNKIESKEVERFVDCVSGNGLTTREINQLAKAFFQGNAEIRKQIENGNLTWALQCLTEEKAMQSTVCTSAEQSILSTLETIQTGMIKIGRRSNDPELKTDAFRAQVNLLTKGILDNLTVFSKAVRCLYDHSR
jgi:hypothetical protein